MLLLPNYILLYILRDALLILQAVPMVFPTVCTVAQVPCYYIGLSTQKCTRNFQISPSMRSDTKRRNGTYDRERLHQVYHEVRIVTPLRDPERGK